LVPLQLQTGDAVLDELLRSATYRVEGVDNPDGDVLVDLNHDQKKELTFVFEEPNQVQIRKKIIFDGERYETDMAVSLKRGEQVMPQVKVAVQASATRELVTTRSIRSRRKQYLSSTIVWNGILRRALTAKAAVLTACRWVVQ
jgi:hypothetical protein